MIELEISFAMCGKRITMENKSDCDIASLKSKLKGIGWVLQLNGPKIDTYCSKGCAK